MAFGPNNEVRDALEFLESQDVEIARSLTTAPQKSVVKVQRKINLRTFEFFAKRFVLHTWWIVGFFMNRILIWLVVDDIRMEKFEQLFPGPSKGDVANWISVEKLRPMLFKLCNRKEAFETFKLV
jgi:hypothetical protein